MRNNALVKGYLLSACVLAIACGGTVDPMVSEVAGGQTGPEGAPLECPSPTAAPPQLTDAQILEVLMVVNEGEILQAQLAQTQATDEDVRAYADEMIAEHTAANQQLSELAANLQLEPTPSPLSEQLRFQAMQMLETLRPQEGDVFDLGYMDAQVAMHATTSFFGDLVLAPQAQDPQLIAEIQTLRGVVQEHLARAVPLQARFSPAPVFRRLQPPQIPTLAP